MVKDILIVILIFLNILQLVLSMRTNGIIWIGRNKGNGKTVYRFEFNNLSDIRPGKKFTLKAKTSDEDLGINIRLYDLEEEGITREK